MPIMKVHASCYLKEMLDVEFVLFSILQEKEFRLKLQMSPLHNNQRQEAKRSEYLLTYFHFFIIFNKNSHNPNTPASNGYAT